MIAYLIKNLVDLVRPVRVRETSSDPVAAYAERISLIQDGRRRARVKYISKHQYVCIKTYPELYVIITHDSVTGFYRARHRVCFSAAQPAPVCNTRSRWRLAGKFLCINTGHVVDELERVQKRFDRESSINAYTDEQSEARTARAWAAYQQRQRIKAVAISDCQGIYG